MAGGGWEEGGKERINTVVVKSSLDLCGKTKVVLLVFTKVESSVLPEPALLLSKEARCKCNLQGAKPFQGSTACLGNSSQWKSLLLL